MFGGCGLSSIDSTRECGLKDTVALVVIANLKPRGSGRYPLNVPYIPLARMCYLQCWLKSMTRIFVL